MNLFNHSIAFIALVQLALADTNVKVGCFSNTTLVETQPHGLKRVSELNYGDMVKTVNTETGKEEFSKFVDYLHFESDEKFDYVLVKTESANLEISERHLIQRRKSADGNLEFVYAR